LKEEYNKKLIIGLLASISNLPGVLLPKEQVLQCPWFKALRKNCLGGPPVLDFIALLLTSILKNA
jgi:hypothetical protein